jgi:predicted dehydrogenase
MLQALTSALVTPRATSCGFVNMAAASSGSGPLRVCVVGAGSISREFAMAHFGPATGTVVVAIVDLDIERALALATDVGSLQAGASVAENGTKYRAAPTETRGTPVAHAASITAVADLCDFVYIGTTPGAHAPLVLESLQLGKHVLMEKPLAASPEDADAIVAAAEAVAGKQWVAMDIGMRWNPALRMLRDECSSGGLGKLVSSSLKMHYMRWPREWQVQPWCAGRAEGGPLREVGTHYFFGLHEIFGHGCIKRVNVTCEFPDGVDGTAAETSAVGTIEMHDGFQIKLDVRTSEPRDLYELEVVGELGTLVLESFSKLRRTTPTVGWELKEGNYGRIEAVTTLVSAVQGTAVPEGQMEGGMISPREGRNAQRLLDAILASGGEWVDVSYE